jgi:hypothetical protein
MRKEEDPPEGVYLQEAGLTGEERKWFSVKTKNKEEVERKMEERWVDFLKEKDKNEQDAEQEVDYLMSLLTDKNVRQTTFVSTSHSFEKDNGVLVVRSSYNEEYDFHRHYKGKNAFGDEYERPAIDPLEAVPWNKHVMDNMRIAAYVSPKGTSVKDLRHIARDNIETEDVQDILRELLDGKPGKRTLNAADNPAEVAKLEPTLHVRSTRSLLRNHKKELGGLEIKQYTIKWDGTRYDMLIDVAP